jgi:hypothetical protein
MTEKEGIGGSEEALAAEATGLLAPGTVIDGRYEVLDLLGRGGCAAVYRVYDRQLRLQLALKLPRSDRFLPEQSIRLRREVRYARRVRSEHLVRIYDVSGDPDLPYITMELVEGETLADRLRREGPMSIDETLRIGGEVLLALQALHDQGIVHRDVKPGNVLLTDEGNVRLADLGLARTMLGDETAATNPESMVGTWQYISPEQALGVRIVPRSDLYSFGIVLFEMLTCSLPFECDSSVGYLVGHLTQPPRRLREVRRGTPRWLDAIVSRLLEKQPGDRYRSASELRTDLLFRRSTPARRYLRPIAAAALLVLFLIGATSSGHLWWGSRFGELVGRTASKEATVAPTSGEPAARAIPSGDYRILRVVDGKEVQHELISVEVEGNVLTVQAPDWEGRGFIRDGRYVGRFKYRRGSTWTDMGTHELDWTGEEFRGGVQFDKPSWRSRGMIWRPVEPESVEGLRVRSSIRSSLRHRN